MQRLVQLGLVALENFRILDGAGHAKVVALHYPFGNRESMSSRSPSGMLSAADRTTHRGWQARR